MTNLKQVAPFTTEAGKIKEQAEKGIATPDMSKRPSLAYKLNLQHFAQATRTGENEIPFGMADIIIGSGDNIIKFDGRNGDKDSYLQVDGGKITIEPKTADIQFADYGESNYDDREVGQEVTVTVVAGQETIDTLKLALSAAVDVKDKGGSVVGITDGPLGTSSRARAKSMRIHPRVAGKDHSRDYNIYKVASNSGLEREFGNEQGKIEIEFKAYPRDNADANKPGNFWYIGAVDPNGVLPPYEELVGGSNTGLANTVETGGEDATVDTGSEDTTA